MQTIPLQQAIEQAKANPNSEFAKQMRKAIESGQLDQAAQKQGIDLSKYGRPTTQPNILGTIINEPIKQLVVKPAVRATEAITRAIAPESIAASGYEEMAKTGESQVFPTALGDINVEQAKSGKQVLGESAQVASYLFPFGKAAKAIGTVAGKTVGNVASGAIGGYIADVGYGLADENQTTKEALTPGVGTAIGAGIPGAGAIAGSVKPVLRGAGRAVQKAGETLTDVVLPTPAKEAQMLQSYKSNKPFLERISDVLSGTETKPRTVAKTAIQTKEGQAISGLFGTKSQIGVQARRASSELWEKMIKPKLDESGVAVDLNGFFSKIENDIIENNPDLTRQKALLGALDSIKQDYDGISAVSLPKLQDLKSSWAEFLPSKAFKGEEIAGSANEVRRLMSDESRKTIYNTLGDDVKQAYLDYGNLQALKEMGVSSMTGQKLKGGAGSFISELASQVVTPIGTVAGQVIYRIGKGLEMIGKPGAKNVGELLNIRFPGDVLMDNTKPYIDAAKKNLKNPKNAQGGFIELGVGQPYRETGNLTTKILKDLEGKTTVSKQYILDATNRGELKQVERDITRNVLDTMKGDTINVKEFADKVKSELLPLKRSDKFFGSKRNKYESITLPDNIRGNVKNYSENIYESPIKTSAGNTHFGKDTDNYFGHTRIEDMADNKTRRVIEVQSDLYQKGNLEREFNSVKDIQKQADPHFEINGSKITENTELKVGQFIKDPNQKYNQWKIKSLDYDSDPNYVIGKIEKYDTEVKPRLIKYSEVDGAVIAKKKPSIDKIMTQAERRNLDVKKLQQYNDPTAHFRMVREEIKKAAQDGKTKLQFPTGETAMKIEGLGEVSRWFNPEAPDLGDLLPTQLKVGREVAQAGDSNRWIITDVLGDGKFKAVPKSMLEKEYPKMSMEAKLKAIKEDGLFNDTSYSESFDISGKVDTNNPIYRFYEKDVQKYLNKFGGKQVVDDKGVSWIEIPIKKEQGKLPVEAFGKAKLGAVAKIGVGTGAVAGALQIRKNNKNSK